MDRNHQHRTVVTTVRSIKSAVKPSLRRQTGADASLFSHLLRWRTGSGSGACSLYCSSPGLSQPSHSMSSTEQRQTQKQRRKINTASNFELRTAEGRANAKKETLVSSCRPVWNSQRLPFSTRNLTHPTTETTQRTTHCFSGSI